MACRLQRQRTSRNSALYLESEKVEKLRPSDSFPPPSSILKNRVKERVNFLSLSLSLFVKMTFLLRASKSRGSAIRCLSSSKNINTSPFNRSFSSSSRLCTPISSSNIQSRSLATSTSASLAPVFGSSTVSSSLFAPLDKFEPRHLGPRENDIQSMLNTLGYQDMDGFLKDAVPASIRLSDTEESKEKYSKTILPLSESELLRRGNEIAGMNQKVKSLIGMGYHNTLVPNVILRNVSRQKRQEEEIRRGREEDQKGQNGETTWSAVPKRKSKRIPPELKNTLNGFQKHHIGVIL